MADLIVNLFDLKFESRAAELEREGIRILRPLPPDRTAIAAFVRREFGEQWASECETSFFHFPVTMWAAVRGSEIAGFACYEATGKGYFGPTGVKAQYRHRGVGGELLLKSLAGLRELGYHYAVIGGAGQEIYPYYHSYCGAVEIPGSTPGIYRDLLKVPE